MDRIVIRDLQARCIVGIRDEERREKQDVTINISLYSDLRTAGRTDRMEDTVDYSGIKKQILAMVEGSQFFLIEALAQAVSDICLGHLKVARVRVQVEKPSALRFARSVGVQIARTRKDAP
jgi:FolB domain-containing protein